MTEQHTQDFASLNEAKVWQAERLANSGFSAAVPEGVYPLKGIKAFVVERLIKGAQRQMLYLALNNGTEVPFYALFEKKGVEPLNGGEITPCPNLFELGTDRCQALEELAAAADAGDSIRCSHIRGVRNGRLDVYELWSWVRAPKTTTKTTTKTAPKTR